MKLARVPSTAFPTLIVALIASRLHSTHEGHLPIVKLPQSPLTTHNRALSAHSRVLRHCRLQDACHLWVCLSRVGVSRKALGTLRDATLAVLAAHVGVLRGHLDALPEALFAGEDFRWVSEWE